MADLRGCGRGNECGELDGDVSVRRREKRCHSSAESI